MNPWKTKGEDLLLALPNDLCIPLGKVGDHLFWDYSSLKSIWLFLQFLATSDIKILASSCGAMFENYNINHK